MRNAKSFWKSKTFWINLLAIIGGITTALSGDIQNGVTLSGLSIANIVLRAVTNQGIKF